LSDICDIQGQIQANSFIKTIKNGTLTKSSDGNWMVENKALIDIS
jgi:hypothetical protein